MNNEQLTEGLFRSMADNMPLGIYVIDQSMNIVYANPAVLKIFPEGLHVANQYLGHFLGCMEAPNHPEMKHKASCRNCELANQHQWVFEHQRSSMKQRIVQQFGSEENRVLKNLWVQTVRLDDQLAMVIVEDQSTENFLH